MTWHKVAQEKEIQENSAFSLEIEGKPLAAYRLGESIYVLDDICTHERAFLSDGYVDGNCIECPVHGGRFLIATGEAQGGIVTEDLRTYPVKIENGVVFVDLG